MDKLFWKICLHLLVLKQLRWSVCTPPYADVSEATSNLKSERQGKGEWGRKSNWGLWS